MKVLVLGADGFIGRHIIFALRAAGVAVLASGRRTTALKELGFQTLKADLTDPSTHDPAFWRPHLAGGVHLVNAAGILTGSDARFKAIHVSAPLAACQARDGGHAVLISAVGIDRSKTGFARWRRFGERAVKPLAALTILRPGLVLADTSYGGSSLIRALAAWPWRTPLVGAGTQPFNPIHAEDLAQLVLACLQNPPGFGPFDVGGPTTVTQGAMIAAYRRWLGLPKVMQIALPLALARGLGRLGDALRIGPLSLTAVQQLEVGVLADPTDLVAKFGPLGRPFSAMLAARPAGTQDLWQARLYLLKPAIRLVLALMWLVSGLVGLTTPPGSFLPILAHLPLGEAALTGLARGADLADLGLALALLRNWRPQSVGWAQLALVIAYTAGFSLIAPSEWLAPLGGLLKNLPVLALIATHIALAEER